MDELLKAFRALLSRVHELERRVGADKWEGVVSHVDADRQMYRQALGEDPDGNPVYGPWVRNPQMSGALKGHVPMTVGQPSIMELSGGDMQQGTIRPGQWNDDNPSPNSAGDENTWTFGAVRVDLTASGLTLTVGGVTYVFDGNGFVQTGGVQEHDGKNVGSDHKHLDVTSGGDKTGVPE